ncbi:hypothetical protein ACFXPI_38600 [Streptomyces sp. NPDC059104]|uniref:DUF7144 family membrane protein n=1 Tax=unclassified Streptomyces TaxID=2593676 RepID=UPI0033ABEFAD
MSQQSTTPRSPQPHSASGAWAAGGTMFAAVLLLVDGVLSVIKGISGIAQDEVYARLGSYVFKFNVEAWGWIHLLLGVVLLIVGAGLLKGAGWARVMGVALASINVIFDFMWLPYTPLWALVSIAISLFIIWALCTDSSRTSTRTA